MVVPSCKVLHQSHSSLVPDAEREIVGEFLINAKWHAADANYDHESDRGKSPPAA